MLRSKKCCKNIEILRKSIILLTIILPFRWDKKYFSKDRNQTKLQHKRNELHLKENCFLPKSNMKQSVLLNPYLRVYKRKLIQTATWILEISLITPFSSVPTNTQNQIYNKFTFLDFYKFWQPCKNQITLYCKPFSVKYHCHFYSISNYSQKIN